MVLHEHLLHPVIAFLPHGGPLLGVARKSHDVLREGRDTLLPGGMQEASRAVQDDFRGPSGGRALI